MYINMEKNFWAIEIHTGKMQKFATVSSQIYLMRYVQRNLSRQTDIVPANRASPAHVIRPFDILFGQHLSAIVMK